MLLLVPVFLMLSFVKLGVMLFFFFFQAEDGIRDVAVTGVQTCALPICVPPERLEEVARHYERMPGGRSPLGALTLAQARGLERHLVRSGVPLPVFVGMRNWHPFLHETLADMTAKGVRRALGVILSPLRSDASWERYQRDVADARA